jgi:hypothetical protein
MQRLFPAVDRIAANNRRVERMLTPKCQVIGTCHPIDGRLRQPSFGTYAMRVVPS